MHGGVARNSRRLRWAAASPWLLLLSFWIVIYMFRSIVMKYMVAVWLLKAPYYLGISTPATPVYVLVGFVILVLLGLSVLKKDELFFLAALFLGGLAMFLSAFVHWHLFMTRTMGT